MRRFILPALVAALLGASFPAHAQEGEGGTAILNAMIYRPVPEVRGVSLRAMDNSDENLALQAELAKVLQAKGYTVDPNAPFLLTFETKEEAGVFSDGGRRHLIELQASGGGVGGDTQSARVNVFDSRGGGLVNEGTGGTRITTPDRHRVDLTLEEKGGQRLWQGWGTVDSSAGTTVDALKPLLAPLVDGIGKTIRRQSVNIP
jgi:hypothetical protein